MTDVLVVGAGHNGLVCAHQLAAAGLSVTMLERRGVVGGAAVTEEFHPGFRNSVASYTVSLLNPTVIRAMDLPRRGLRIVERRMQNFLPLPDGRALEAGPGRTRDSLARFSPRDVAALDVYEARMEEIARVLRVLALETPPNVTDGGLVAAVPQLVRSAGLARRLGTVSMETRRELLEIFTASAAEYLERFFESEPIKALFGFDGVVGNFASPYTPGTAYVLAHHAFGEVNGKSGVWGHAIGGMGAITQAMRAACADRGVAIHTEAPVAEILVEKGRAVGAVTQDGRVFRARLVVSGLNPKLLFTRLVDPAVLPTDFLDRMRRWRCGSGTFRMNVALSELPSFTAAPGRAPADHHTAGIIIAPSLAYMDRAHTDARAHGWSREPIVEMLIPSTLDDGLAPAGAHVASLFCQHVLPELPDGFPGGSSWDDHRETVADLMIATVDRAAPGFAASVIARQIKSPLDLERDFGLLGGDIFHGALSLGQLFSARPALGHADYRAPVPGLYLCGSGSHPGGGVTGAPGYNAAREILADLRRRRVPA